MIREKHMTFTGASGQAVTANAASTDKIDLGYAREMAYGARPLYVVVQCTTAMTDSGDNSNCTVYLRSDADSAFGSPTNCQTLGVFATNSAVGTRLVQVLQPLSTDERYLDLYFSMGNGDLSTGTFVGFITPDPDLQMNYPNNYTVSTS